VGSKSSVGFSPGNIIAARRPIEQLGSRAPVWARSFSIVVNLIESTDPSGHLGELAAEFLADSGSTGVRGPRLAASCSMLN